MALTPRSWTLLDARRNVYIEELALSAPDVPGAPEELRIAKRRLRGGASDGVDAIDVETGEIGFTVLPTRGMSLGRAWRGPLRLGWDSPVKGPIHPAFVPLMEPGGLGWLFGFDELLVRCGLESNGPPVFDESGRLIHPLHGRIANRPADSVELSIEGDEIRITGRVEEGRLFHNHLLLETTIRARFGRPEVEIADSVTNQASGEGQLALLYHINFGPPLLEEGARVVAPVKTLVPRDAAAAEGVTGWDTYGPPTPGFAEQAFYFELAGDTANNTQVLLRNAAGDLGAALAFNLDELPAFILWKCTQPEADGYVTGLEPAVNFPNPRSFEEKQGRILSLAPGETRTFRVTLTAHTDPASVSSAEAAIARLSEGLAPVVHPHPMLPWSPESE